MAKTLSELVADAAAADDMVLTAADGTTYKLSDVRGFRSGVETERQAAAREREIAIKAAKEAKQVFDALTAAKAELDKQQTPPEPERKGKRWQDNPLYDEIVPVLEEAQKAAKEAREMAASNKAALDTATATYALERMRRQWAEAPVKPNKPFEEVVQEVIANRELDASGLPTLEKYLYRATEPDRVKQAVATALADAKKEREKAAHAAAIPKPGRFQTRKSTEAPIKNLNELTSDVVGNDPDIAAAMDGTPLQ